jgi:hypothetical protein
MKGSVRRERSFDTAESEDVRKNPQQLTVVVYI